MPIASFILLSFSVNPFFFNSLIVAYVRIFPYVQNVRIISRKNSHILQKNVVFDAFFRDEGYLYTNYLFYILTIYCKCFTFQFLSRGMLLQIIIVIVAFLVAKNKVIFC